MEKKKQTNGQLQRRIDNALIHIDATKDTTTVYFSDKGLRITVNEEYAIIATGYHQHVFSNFTTSGISRPWLYTKRLAEIANENDCRKDDGYSFSALLESLKAKEDQSEYNICVYIEWWMYNIFSPLYTIGETTAESFMVYEDYVHNIARQSILLSEKTEEMTNKQFVSKVMENMKEYTDGIAESVIFEKRTDEDIIRENIAALQQQQTEDVFNENKD